MTAAGLRAADAWRELRTHDLTAPAALIPWLLAERRRQRKATLDTPARRRIMKP